MGVGKGMLVAMPGRWDEACFAVPALRALLRSGLVGGIVCSEEQEDFWNTVCDIRIVTCPAKSGVRSVIAKIGEGWEASLVWEAGVFAKAFAKAGIGKRLGQDNDSLKKLLTHPMAVKEGATEHRVRMYLKTCELMGIPVDRPEFFTAAPLGIPATPGSILLCPGSDYGTSHEWPLDRWQELAEELLEKGKRVTVAGVVGGRGRGKILAGRLGSEVEFFHAAPLAAAMPLLAAHQLIVSADGSLPHLAAHAGSTCVTLFGPNDAVWKRPLGKRHVVVKRHVECAPCLSPKCLMGDLRCQAELEVAKVLAAVPGSF